jgi:hypothetical protein
MQSEFRSERLDEELTINNVELRYGRRKIIIKLFKRWGMRELKGIYILVHNNKRMCGTRYERGHISRLAYDNFAK